MTFEEEARKKLDRYISGTERVFREMDVKPPSDESLRKNLESNISLSRQYLADSKYYLDKGDFITALICIAYCEGLIDACKNLGWLGYEWAFNE
jgi:FAD synthetase